MGIVIVMGSRRCSAGASLLIAQYYQFLRLGFQGYNDVMEVCSNNAKYLRDGIVATGYFTILSKDMGVPLVAFNLKDQHHFDEYEIASKLRYSGWTVPAYTMTQTDKCVKLLRVIVREDFSRALADRLLRDLSRVLDGLGKHPPAAVMAVSEHLMKKKPDLMKEMMNRGGDGKNVEGKKEKGEATGWEGALENAMNRMQKMFTSKDEEKHKARKTASVC
eukprot:TRINITY_DN4285_c0_g1_i1.p1 TRINITY_DN4285_c0_g1~~TRINITY_DN4285_c0_g1_i1.p1  ORF type:complete len:219 (-),score=41.30 TRINITY_DN4285_c0_g1_i1:833-1489(-)